MVIRSRAPLRIGFAGGGTDLREYSDRFGGSVFNATIGMYSYCTIVPTQDGMVRFQAPDRRESVELKAAEHIELSDPLILHRGVYNRVVREFNGGKPLSLFMSTSSDAPAGSGLGSSSTMVVTILEAYNRWLRLNLSAYRIANLAYEIEREDIGLAGGKQDQYAAVFGGFNRMEFRQDGSVVINTLRVEKQGAGGGGFILLYCDPVNRQQLFEALKQKGGIVFPVKFSKCGAESWVAEE